MAITQKVTCDAEGCSAERGPSNHWILMGVDGNGAVTFSPWDAEEATYKKHICGQSCASKMLSKALEGWTR